MGDDTCEAVMLMTSVEKRNDFLNQYRAVPSMVPHKMEVFHADKCCIVSRCVHPGMKDSYLLLLVSLDYCERDLYCFR